MKKTAQISIARYFSWRYFYSTRGFYWCLNDKLRNFRMFTPFVLFKYFVVIITSIFLICHSAVISIFTNRVDGSNLRFKHFKYFIRLKFNLPTSAHFVWSTPNRFFLYLTPLLYQRSFYWLILPFLLLPGLMLLF